jgi:molybdopterin converting factor small subunit
MATIKIPPVLRPSVGGEREVSADGELNRYVNVYLNDEDVRVLDGLSTPVGEADSLVILPAMAGGSS